jgi:hypothetical protein
VPDLSSSWTSWRRRARTKRPSGKHTESESKPESDFSAEDLRAQLAADPGVRVQGRVRLTLDPRARVQGRVRLALDPRESESKGESYWLWLDPRVRVQGRVRSGKAFYLD